MKIGMLFPDYGSQFVGMGKELYDSSRLIQEYFEEAFNCLNTNFVKLCFASSDAELAKMENAYVSIFLVSVATANLLKQEGIVPHVVAGHGIGELSALCIANGLSLPDGLYLLSKYALFYQELLQTISVGLIQAEGLSDSKAVKLCKKISQGQDKVTVIGLDGDNHPIMSGTLSAIERFKQELSQEKIKIKTMPIEYGLHNDLMAPVVDQLIQYLEKIDFKNTSIPLIASIDGSLVTKKDLVRRRVIKQFQSPILWNKVLHQCKDWDIILEIGPGTTLSHAVRKAYPDKQFFSINKLSDILEVQKLITESTAIKN